MPEVVSPIDQAKQERGGGASVARHAATGPSTQPARSLLQAIWRGFCNRCPACGAAHLFRTFLKPADLCPACGQDWTHQCADDFPAYIAILIAGHVLVPMVILVDQLVDLPTWSYFAFWLPLAAALVIALLQPAKGGVIAVQWWFGLHGFAEGAKARAADQAAMIPAGRQDVPTGKPAVSDVVEYVCVGARYGWATFNLTLTRAQARRILDAPIGTTVDLARSGETVRFDDGATLHYRRTDRGGEIRSEYLDGESARMALRRMLERRSDQ